MDVTGLVPSDRDVDGVVEMTLDVTGNYADSFTEDRLFGWRASLFPTGRGGMQAIRVGNWRDDSAGPIQVVSGALGCGGKRSRESVPWPAITRATIG